MEKYCQHCGCLYKKKTKTSMRQWNKSSFCSVPCKSHYLGKRWEGKNSSVWVDVNREKGCLFCKNKFTVKKPSRVNQVLYCSKKCFYESQKGRKPWNTGNVEYKKCLVCNKQIRKWLTYCSQECYIKNKPETELLTKTCLFCKNIFQVHLTDKKQKYCSDKCSRIAMGIRHRGEGHPSWKGGCSFKPYSTDWTETLKRSIRERDRYTCQVCGKEPSIQVHHVDYDKKNCNPINLITLCKKCHSKTNWNRDKWINYFKLERIGY